jgi:hypothetical protein
MPLLSGFGRSRATRIAVGPELVQRMIAENFKRLGDLPRGARNRVANGRLRSGALDVASRRPDVVSWFCQHWLDDRKIRRDFVEHPDQLAELARLSLELDVAGHDGVWERRLSGQD